MYEPKRCPVCTGRGWVLPKGKRTKRDGPPWPIACGTCGGRGGFTMRALAKLLDEGYATLCRVDDLRAKPETAKRVFRKLIGRFESTTML